MSQNWVSNSVVINKTHTSIESMNLLHFFSLYFFSIALSPESDAILRGNRFSFQLDSHTQFFFGSALNLMQKNSLQISIHIQYTQCSIAIFDRQMFLLLSLVREMNAFNDTPHFRISHTLHMSGLNYGSSMHSNRIVLLLFCFGHKWQN